MKAPSPGMRTFVFGVLALVFLLVGLSLALVARKVDPDAVAALFSSFAWAVVGVFWGVAGKHLGESLATGTGLAGALKTLVGEQKPPAPPAGGTP